MMDQSTARKLAAQVGGVATQEARNKGQWGSKTDPWVVVCGSVLLRDVPGEEPPPEDSDDFPAPGPWGCDDD